MQGSRLDLRLCDLALADSREKARALIMAGSVFVNGQRQTKPGTGVKEEDQIEVKGKTLPYVSRGGLKLEKALDTFSIDCRGLQCVDCGASTGGFTDCLLQRGAAHVHAVDVGYGQLDWKIRSDRRVTVMERCNARYLSPEQFPAPLDLAVMDMSFISLRLVLPAVKGILKREGQVVCLIKPQFEAGREKVGKKGVVRDPEVHSQVLAEVTGDAGRLGFFLRGLTYSPVRGPEGNIEYLAWFDQIGPACQTDLEQVVRLSHQALAGKNEESI